MRAFLHRVCRPLGQIILGAILWTNLGLASGEARFPLSTAGRYVVDRDGQRFKLKSANWYGFHNGNQVLQGLDRQPIESIVGLIRQWGFNSIRLTFSNQMLHDSRPVDDASVAANPQYRGMSSLQIFDETIRVLTEAGIAVVLNNHTTYSGWCCNFDTNGLWHNEGAKDPWVQSSAQWQDDWVMITQRYRHNKAVVGADLRNEVRTGKYRGTFIPSFPNWGKGDDNDWFKAATEAGNRILELNPDLLIIVEGINWTGTIPLLGSGERPHLQPVRELPINLIIPNKLVYAAHNYAFTGPNHTGDDKTSPGRIRYGQMDEATFRQTIEKEFGFVVQAEQYFSAPVWMSEFGAARDESDPATRAWFSTLVSYLIEKDMDFAYWPLNSEGFGLVSEDWSRNLTDDWRYQDLSRLLSAPMKSGPFAKDRLRRIAVADRNENLSLSNEDWLPHSRKGSCATDERMMGLSQDHKALCLYTEEQGSFALVPRFQVEGKSETAARTHGITDWAPGLTKYECPSNFVAVGYAQEKLRATGLLCASSDRTLSNNCRTIDFQQGDQRLSQRGGDWAVNSYKGQCADTDYMAGYAHRSGKVQAVLCCSL